MITWRTHLREAIRQLLASKTRAFLAVLGILVGTASVVAMISIGQLAENQILSQFEQLGINLLSVSIQSANYSQQSSARDSLSLDEANNIVNSSNNIELAAPYVMSYGNISFLGNSLNGSAVGVTPNMFRMAKLQLIEGRRLSFLDANDYFCVIGHQLYQAIKKQTGKSPLYQQVSVGSSIFTIVGILGKWPTNYFFNTDFNDAIIIPITTAMGLEKNAQINNIALRIINTNNIEPTKVAIQSYVAANTVNQQVTVHSPKTLIDSMKKSARTMTLLLGMIGSISLIVGGIGVMNIMLVSIAERHREIGVRMAIGARQSDIQWQFLMESVTLSVCGGIAGLILGLIVTDIVAWTSHWQFKVFLMPPLVGFGVSVMVGIFFGFYPAYKASKLDPITTLRSE